MKTAILIVGHIRTWPDCKDNFLEAFGHLNPDVFVSTYDLRYNYHPAQRHWMGLSSDEYLSEEEIHSFFDGINLIHLDVEEIDSVLEEYKTEKRNIDKRFQEETNTFLQYRKLFRCLKFMLEQEEKLDILYDNVIKIRADILHNKFDYEINESEVIISSGNVFPNDVILATTRDKFIEIIAFILKEFYIPVCDDSHLKAPHNLLLCSFMHSNLDVMMADLMDCVIRKTGKQYYHDIK